MTYFRIPSNLNIDINEHSFKLELQKNKKK